MLSQNLSSMTEIRPVVGYHSYELLTLTNVAYHSYELTPSLGIFLQEVKKMTGNLSQI